MSMQNFMPFSFSASDFVSSYVFSPFDANENLKLAMSDVVYIGLDSESESLLEVVETMVFYFFDHNDDNIILSSYITSLLLQISPFFPELN